jgi:hypothetical protein
VRGEITHKAQHTCQCPKKQSVPRSPDAGGMGLHVECYELAHLRWKIYAHTLRPHYVQCPEYTWDATSADICDYVCAHGMRLPSSESLILLLVAPRCYY